MNEKIKLARDARIMLIKMGGLGDCVLMTPTLRALREAYPQASIDCMVRDDNTQLLYLMAWLFASL